MTGVLYQEFEEPLAGPARGSPKRARSPGSANLACHRGCPVGKQGRQRLATIPVHALPAPGVDQDVSPLAAAMIRAV